MTEALARIFKEEFEQKKEEGFKQGIEKGIEQGIEQGIEKGVEQGRFQFAVDLVTQGVFTFADAAKQIGMTEEEFMKKAKEYLEETK